MAQAERKGGRKRVLVAALVDWECSVMAAFQCQFHVQGHIIVFLGRLRVALTLHCSLTREMLTHLSFLPFRSRPLPLFLGISSPKQRALLGRIL